MRILLITVRSDFGGGPRHVNDLLNNLQAEYEVYLAAPEGIPFYNKWKSNPRIKKLFTIPFRKFSATNFIKLARFAKKNKIELIHSHGRGAGIYSRLLKALLPKARIIHTVHGFYFQDYALLKRMTAVFIERILSPLTETVIAVSNGEKDNMTAFNIWNPDKIKIIYNGVEGCEMNMNSAAIREKLGLPADKFIVVSIVRFNSLKNIGMTLEIAERLKDSKDILFVVVGDGEEFFVMNEIKDKKDLRNVIFTGFKENALEYIKASDVYLSTSIREGMPISLIEACMLGIPILASDVTGNNEAAIDGENGFLFKLNDIETPVKKILELSSDIELLRIMSAKAQEIFKQKFTIGEMTKKAEEIYTSIN